MSAASAAAAAPAAPAAAAAAAAPAAAPAAAAAAAVAADSADKMVIDDGDGGDGDGDGGDGEVAVVSSLSAEQAAAATAISLAELKPGTPVWALVPSYPWWPGVVAPIEMKPNHASVLFFGSYDRSAVKVHSVRLVTDDNVHSDVYRNAKSKSKRWEQTLRVAHEELDRFLRDGSLPRRMEELVRPGSSSSAGAPAAASAARSKPSGASAAKKASAGAAATGKRPAPSTPDHAPRKQRQATLDQLLGVVPSSTPVVIRSDVAAAAAMAALTASGPLAAHVPTPSVTLRKESRRVKAMLALGLCPPVGAQRLIDNNNTVV